MAHDEDCPSPQVLRPRLPGRWPWRWLVLSRIAGKGSISFTAESSAADSCNGEKGGQCSGHIVITTCPGTNAESLSLPIRDGGVSRIQVLTTVAAGRPGPASASWLVWLDRSGTPLAVPAIPAGYTTRFARPDDRCSLWWDLNELEDAAARWGVGVDRRITRQVGSERELGRRMPLGLDAVSYYNFMIFVAMMGLGIVSLLTVLAFARHGLETIAWILVGAMIAVGLVAGLLRFLVTTGWMETNPNRPVRPS